MRTPTIAEFFVASRYALLPWALFGLWLYGEVWPRLNTENRNILVGALIVWVLAWIKASFKVFPYEQERRQRRSALLDPEERKVKQRREQWCWRMLLFIAIGGFSLWWVVEQSPDEDPELYFFAASLVLLFSMVGLVILYRQCRQFFTTSVFPWFRKSGGTEDKNHIVSWSQPIPPHSPHPNEICKELPSYCKGLIEQSKSRIMEAEIGRLVAKQVIGCLDK